MNETEPFPNGFDQAKRPRDVNQNGPAVEPMRHTGDDENINLDQSVSIVKTNEGTSWKELIKSYVNLFGAVNYEELTVFIRSNVPSHFVEDRARIYTRAYFYARPLYMGQVHEALRFLIKSCPDQKHSTEREFRVPYLQLKQQFAKSYIVDYFVTKLELHSPVELLFLLPQIINVNVDARGVSVSILREVDLAKDDIEIIYSLYRIVYQNQKIHASDMFHQLAELRSEHHDEAKVEVHEAIYEQILLKHHQLFTFHRANDDVIVTISVQSRYNIIAQLMAVILTDYTLGLLPRHKLMATLYTQFELQITTDEIETILKQNSESFYFDCESDLVQLWDI